MLAYRITVILAFLLNVFSSYAAYDFNSNCKKAYNEIINLRFSQGKTLLADERKNNPSNLIPCYLENYIDFLSLIISEDKQKFDLLKNNQDIRINQLEKGDKNSPYYSYCLAEVYMQWAFVRLKFEDYTNAAYEINKAYNLLTKNAKDFPDFMPNYKGLGILHAIIGTIPDNYKWIFNIIHIEGSVEQGISELNKLLNLSLKNKEYEYLKTETIFILTYVQANLQKDKEGLSGLKEITEKMTVQEKDNPMIIYCRAYINMKLQNNDNAINILMSYKTKEGVFPFYYLYYLTGKAKLNKMDPDADVYLLKYITNFKGQNYIKAAYQKLAWFYLLKGDKNKYDLYVSKVLNSGKASIDEDKQAVLEVKGKAPNIYLLKARLLCDGGYYHEAIKALVEKKPSEIFTEAREYLEFTYRFARIYHEMGQTNEAISYYKMTLKNGENFTYYFAANSALHLGYIYENLKDFKTAGYYFNKCLSMKNEEYKNSIEQKAKAGLNRIKNKQ